MFTSSELERFSMQLDEPMSKLEMRIMEDIVRRIRENGEVTRAADWQINRLYQLGMSYDEIDAAIAQALGLTEEDMEALYSDIISKGYARDKRLYDKTGTPFIPFEENDELRQLISSVAAQTSESLENITQSLGFAIKQNGAVSFLPIAKYYQRTLDSAMLDIASGAFDYNTVLKRVISELTNSGLRTVDYATGHSNRVEVAARRALQTGIGQLTDKVNNDNAEALGTDHFEVTVSRCARPTHAVWQGRVYSSADLVRVCGLGRVDGLCGANCYHDKHPFVPGISERVYSDEELDELRRQENTPREWNGKQYTAYEASQRQRRLETTMRAQRQKIKLLEEGGASDDELIAARARYRATSAEYSRFSQAMGIPQQRERVTVDGLGSIGQGKYTGGSGKESPVKVPPVGSKVTNKVTAADRRELLSRNKVDIADNAKTAEKELDKAAESGIIEEGRLLFLNDLDDFEKWQNDYYELNKDVSFSRGDNPNIYQYTGGSYEAINGVLRGGESLERVKRRYGSSFKQAKYEEVAKGISDELSKFKLNETLELKRSVGNVDFITGATSSIEDMKNSIGKIYIEKGFSSTTVCGDTTLPFGGIEPTRTTLEIVADKRYTRGAYIYKISEHAPEFEFLIDKNTAYKVLDAGEREIEVKDFRGNIRVEKERYMRLLVVKND